MLPCKKNKYKTGGRKPYSNGAEYKILRVPRLFLLYNEEGMYQSNYVSHTGDN